MKTLGPDNSELCPTEGARQRTSPSCPTSSLAHELLTWRHGAAACRAAGAAAAASPERPWPCGLCAGQVQLAPAQAKLLCLRPRGGTRRAGARRRVERALGEDGTSSLPRPAPPRATVPPPLARPAARGEASAHRIAPGGRSAALRRAPRASHTVSSPLLSEVRRPRPSSSCGPCCLQTSSSTCLPGAQTTRTQDEWIPFCR